MTERRLMRALDRAVAAVRCDPTVTDKANWVKGVLIGLLDGARVTESGPSDMPYVVAVLCDAMPDDVGVRAATARLVSEAFDGLAVRAVDPLVVRRRALERGTHGRYGKESR